MSMNGPSVNLTFSKILYDQMKTEFLDGVNGLYIVNACMRTWMEIVHSDLHTFVRDVYYLWNDCPARVAEFTAITSGNTFPLKVYNVQQGG